MRAGIVLWYDQYPNFDCSNGFTAHGADGSHWAVTAGHCSGINVIWGHGAQYIGPMRSSVVQTGVRDVGRIRIDNPYWRQSTWGWIYKPVTGSTPTDVPVDDIIETLNGLHVGMIVCLAAWHSTTGNSYGNITGKYIDMWVVGNFDACPGDSGGGWHTSEANGIRREVGIHQGGPRTCHDASGYSVFTDVPHIYDYWDLTSATTIRFDER